MENPVAATVQLVDSFAHQLPPFVGHGSQLTCRDARYDCPRWDVSGNYRARAD
jgi:hypothetical protein